MERIPPALASSPATRYTPSSPPTAMAMLAGEIRRSSSSLGGFDARHVGGFLAEALHQLAGALGRSSDVSRQRRRFEHGQKGREGLGPANQLVRREGTVGPDDRRCRHEQGRLVDVDPRPGSGRGGRREVDEHRGAVPVDDDVAGPQASVDQTGVVQARHVAPQVVEDAVGDLAGVELVERGPGRGDGDLHGVVVGSGGAHRDELWHGDVGTLCQQQQQGPVLHLSEPGGGEPGSALLVPDTTHELAGRSVPRRCPCRSRPRRRARPTSPWRGRAVATARRRALVRGR